MLFRSHGAPPITITVDGTAEFEARVIVRDHGPGLPPELAPVVFDRFVRGDRSRRSEGSGLGLAIVHEIAQRHGATIEVADGTGQRGTRFTVSMPGA